jgi:hypothetical protein
MSETTYRSFSDLPPELPLAFRLKQLVKAAGKYAEDFGSQPSVTKILTAYALEPGISSWFDPQTYWGIKHLKKWPDSVTDTGDFVSFIGFLQSKAFQSKLPKRVEVTSHYHPYYNKETWKRQVKEWLKPSP